jgi:hypothetical protein
MATRVLDTYQSQQKARRDITMLRCQAYSRKASVKLCNRNIISWAELLEEAKPINGTYGENAITRLAAISATYAVKSRIESPGLEARQPVKYSYRLRYMAKEAKLGGVKKAASLRTGY